MSDLLRVLLCCPARDAAVPTARFPGWQRPASLLHDALRRHGVRRRFRSWQSLWTALHNSPPARSATWGGLLGDFTLNFLVERVSTPPPAGWPLLSFWNLGWLVDPHTDAAIAKRLAVSRMLRTQSVVGIAETHWDAATADRWAGLFTLGSVIAAPARPGPAAGRQGGVAAVVPPNFVVDAHSVLVPGCALAVDLTLKSNQFSFTLLLLYFPPDDRCAVLERLVIHRSFSRPVFVMGDVNFDPHHSRMEEERQLSDSFLEWTQVIGSVAIPLSRATRRRGREEAILDMAAVPSTEAWRWECSPRWEDESDHAVLCLRAAHGALPSATPCTPTTIKLLPPEAFHDLRGRFQCLQWQF